MLALLAFAVLVQSPRGESRPQGTPPERPFMSELKFQHAPFEPVVAQANDVIGAEEADAKAFLKDDELVVGVWLGDHASAWPLQSLSVVEALNTRLGEKPLLVTWCVVCQSAIVYVRKVGDRELTFGNQRALYHYSLVVYDVETHSYWVQGTGRAMAGEMKGSVLEAIPSSITSWKQWRARHPDTTVYAGLHEGADRRNRVFAFDPERFGEIGLVVRVAGSARLYPLNPLRQRGLVEDVVDDVPIAIVYSLERQVLRAFRRDPGGKPIELSLLGSAKEAAAAPDDPSKFVLVEEGGSRRWRADTGMADAPDSKGGDLPPLERIVAHPLRIARFAELFPEGTIWKPAGSPPPQDPPPPTGE